MAEDIPVVPESDPADRQALTEDTRLIRGVRWRLVAWSGLTTLLVLAVLGVALYLSASRTLEDNGLRQLDTRAGQIVDALENPSRRPGGPQYGYIFGGSGTFAMAVDAQGHNLSRGPNLPDGLPVADSVVAATTTGRDLRLSSIPAIDPQQQPTIVPIRVLTQRVTTDVGDAYIQVIQDRTAEQ
jgi:hypothetical protein